MDPEQAGLVEGLVARSPGLDALLAQHRDANSGATLPFVYFGLVASWASDKAARVAHDEELTAVLHWLEERFVAGTDNERNLIVLGFVEGLDTPRERGAGIRQVLPPQLRAIYDTFN